MSESNYAKKALPEYQKEHPETILMRNNTGMAWQGEVSREYKPSDQSGSKPYRLLKNPRPIYFGVGLSEKDKKTGRMIQKGGGDYIGWTEKEIAAPCCGSCEKNRNCEYIWIEKIPNITTYFELLDLMRNNKCNLYKIPDSKKQKIAIFTSLETKSEDGKESPEQIRFRETVQKAGGIAIVLREK